MLFRCSGVPPANRHFLQNQPLLASRRSARWRGALDVALPVFPAKPPLLAFSGRCARSERRPWWAVGVLFSAVGPIQLEGEPPEGWGNRRCPDVPRLACGFLNLVSMFPRTRARHSLNVSNGKACRPVGGDFYSYIFRASSYIFRVSPTFSGCYPQVGRGNFRFLNA
mgnify:CR=1 FL=1